MQRKPLDKAPCPIARTVARIGDAWSVLILREAFYGTARFDDFEKSLGIAPNMLARRLCALVEEGLLERRSYCERPPRFEYVLTPSGRDFRPVLVALLAWGNRHFSPEGESVQLLDRETGARVEPVLVDAANGRPITEAHYALGPGPAATERMRQKLNRAAVMQAASASNLNPIETEC
ncbi:winged helix-turn-helix transcriptional regulator [Cupriavidus pinatubonensis]|uniref:winged helix-turn-helix transcriptional regulator n=1 Tax=Cupriavidus pinatubonensis TaxID=248026 RepID=UPI00360E6FE8